LYFKGNKILIFTKLATASLATRSTTLRGRLACGTKYLRYDNHNGKARETRLFKRGQLLPQSKIL